MRRVKKITAVVLLAALSTGMVAAQDLSEVFVNDNGRNDIRLEETSGTVYKLIFPVRNTETVFVKIYDLENHLVYSEKIRNKYGFTRPYDFKDLPDGSYQVRIWTNAGKIIRNFVLRKPVNDLMVAVEETKGHDSYKLIVKGVTKKPLYVDIYDENEELVFEEVLKVDSDFSRVYSFDSKVENPRFTVT
jgi:hypothetical protein